MEPRSPEDGVTSLVGLPSRDMIYAAGFGLGRSDGMVGAPRRRGDGVEAAGVLPSRQPAGAPLEVRARRPQGRIGGYVGPDDSLRGVCGRFRTAEIPAPALKNQFRDELN